MKAETTKYVLLHLPMVMIAIVIWHLIINFGIVAADELLLRAAGAAMLITAIFPIFRKLRKDAPNIQHLGVAFIMLNLTMSASFLAVSAVLATNTPMLWSIALGVGSSVALFCVTAPAAMAVGLKQKFCG